MKKHTIVFLLVFFALCLGIWIYATTRTDVLYLNQWLDKVGGDNLKDFLHKLSSGVSIPYWIVYSLPDALWMFTLTLIIMMIWNFKLNIRSLPWIAGALCVGILFEISQGLHWIRGTFDWVDLISLGIGAFIPVSLTLLNRHLCKLK